VDASLAHHREVAGCAAGRPWWTAPLGRRRSERDVVLGRVGVRLGPGAGVGLGGAAWARARWPCPDPRARGACRRRWRSRGSKRPMKLMAWPLTRCSAAASGRPSQTIRPRKSAGRGRMPFLFQARLTVRQPAVSRRGRRRSLPSEHRREDDQEPRFCAASEHIVRVPSGLRPSTGEETLISCRSASPQLPSGC
jgi:hypothetical protein